MKKINFFKGMVLVFASLLLFGCGGGGSSDDGSIDVTDSPQPPPSAVDDPLPVTPITPPPPPPPPQAVVDDPPPPEVPVPMYISSGVGTQSPPSHLHTIIPETGEIATDIGRITVAETGLEPAITDLAVTPGGLLYGCSYDTLYLINTQTALATDLGSLGVSGVNALAFNKTTGFLYGGTTSGKILNINPNKPQEATVLFELSPGYSSSGDMVFSPEGILYASLKREGQEDDFIAVIDLENGTFQTLNETGSGAINIFGLSYFNGELYGVTAASTTAYGMIWWIDLPTGKAIFIDVLPFSAFGSN
ncbi:MAG: hypothetical protein IH613_14355 [Desulfuromonadales bacterium]|nr:hypothetical protein [Desulfuromonadales bacterium]